MKKNESYLQKLDIKIEESLKWYIGVQTYEPSLTNPFEIHFNPTISVSDPNIIESFEGSVVFNTESNVRIEYKIIQFNPYGKIIRAPGTSIRTCEFICEKISKSIGYNYIYINVKHFMVDQYDCGGSKCDVMYDFNSHKCPSDGPSPGEASEENGGGTGGSMRR